MKEWAVCACSDKVGVENGLIVYDCLMSIVIEIENPSLLHYKASQNQSVFSEDGARGYV